MRSKARFAGYESDNLEAVYQFFLRTTAQTPAAKKIQDDFLNWHASTKAHTWFYTSEDEVKKAFEFRDRFNRANAVTPTQKEKVEQVISSGVTSGHYTSPDGDKSPIRALWDAFPTWQKTLAIVGGAAFLGVQGVKAAPLLRAILIKFKR